MGLSVFCGDVGSYRFGRLCHDRYAVPPLVSRTTNKRDEEDISAIREGLFLRNREFMFGARLKRGIAGV